MSEAPPHNNSKKTTKKEKRPRKNTKKNYDRRRIHQTHRLTTRTTATTIASTTIATFDGALPTEPAATATATTGRDAETSQTTSNAVPFGSIKPVNRPQERRQRKRARRRTLREKTQTLILFLSLFLLSTLRRKNSLLKHQKTISCTFLSRTHTHTHDNVNALENRSDAEYAINADRLYIRTRLEGKDPYKRERNVWKKPSVA